jgi:hypothetical protein
MSEYQYYEFQAIDRPLTRVEQEMLRSISSRGRITATSFSNHYEWGDFKGDPRRLMESCFDLHLYFANWGTRRLMIRVPIRLIDRGRLTDFLSEVDWVTTWISGPHLIIDIRRDEVEPDDDQWDDGAGWLAALAPLRSDLLSGDLRLFYLLWLSAVEDGFLRDETLEPLPGIGPMTGALDAAVEFFDIDPDLVQAAAAVSPDDGEPSPEAMRDFLATLSEQEKTDLLARLMEGDAHVGSELRQRARERLGRPDGARRTVGELRETAREIHMARERIEAERREAELRRNAEEVEKARRARLDALKRRGSSVWKDIEAEIERRNASGYDRSAALLADLKTIASEQGAMTDFSNRLRTIRERHARKGQFIMRLQGL